MRARPRLTVMFVLLLLVATLVGCSGTSSGDAHTLTLYTGQDRETTQRLVAAFERQTDLHVNIRADDESALANDIADARSKRSADVFYTENTPPLRLLETKHLLAPVTAATLAKVDPRWQSSDRDWVGVSARVGMMDYNVDTLKESSLPASVMELADPEWKGRIGIAPADTDFQAVVASILVSHGEDPTIEWLEDVKANAASFVYSDNRVLADAINRGQVDLGVLNQHSWFRERAQVGAARMHSAVAFFQAQDAGYLLGISGAAIVRSSHAPAAAQELVAFLVSRAGAEIIARSKSYEYPLGSNVEADPGLPEFNGLQPVNATAVDIGLGNKVVDLLRQVGLL
jgi:iron(III) transport system substrate-binding protein